MTLVQFRDKRSGKLVSFHAKSARRSPAKTLKQLNKRLKKLKSPKMRANAREKWLSARR